MAARPQVLQHLRRGWLLTGRTFPWFVETWNWLVDGFDGFVGDGNLNPQQGTIFVDRINPSRPVIRWKGVQGGGGIGDTFHQGRFSIDAWNGSTMKLKNCYYRVGGRTYAMSDAEISVGSSGVVALVVSVNASEPSANVTVYNSLSSLQDAERNIDSYIVPLFLVNDSKIECDLRIGPDCAMGEF